MFILSCAFVVTAYQRSPQQRHQPIGTYLDSNLVLRPYFLGPTLFLSSKFGLVSYPQISSRISSQSHPGGLKETGFLGVLRRLVLRKIRLVMWREIEDIWKSGISSLSSRISSQLHPGVALWGSTFYWEKAR